MALVIVVVLSWMILLSFSVVCFQVYMFPSVHSYIVPVDSITMIRIKIICIDHDALVGYCNCGSTTAHAAAVVQSSER